MTVKIKPYEQLVNPGYWYGECSGVQFEVWKNEFLPGLYFVHPNLFIPGEDLIIISKPDEKELPKFSTE